MPTDFEKFWEGQIQEKKVFACPEQKEEIDNERRSTRQGVTGVFDSKAYHGVGIL
jgi:hypothetical protein